MKIVINNKIYFKSKFQEFEFPNLNLSNVIINSIRSKPDELLIVDEDQNKLTSHEIANLTEKVAKGFNIQGLNKGDVVGIISLNLNEFLYGMLGILLSGGIVSPINPNSTIDEIKNTLSTLSPKYILINHSNYIRIKDHIPQLFNQCRSIIVINDNSSNGNIPFEQQININSNQSIKILGFKQFVNNDGSYDRENALLKSIDDTSLILFSSGTTGNFKGVCISHGNSISCMIQIIKTKYQHYKEKQKFISSLPFYHTYAIHIIVFPIIYFGNCCLVSMKKYNIQRFLSLIQNEKVTTSFIVPPIAVDLAKSPLVEKYDCSSLKVILTGAAPFPKDIIMDLNKRIGKGGNNQDKKEYITIVQGYGLTEATGIVSVSNMYKYKHGSSGEIIPNVVVKVIDLENGNQLDTNQVGEFCIKGPNIMMGYFNNISATKDTFDNEGFFCTGDIGYIDDDGELYIIDRKKELIKSYGYQVAPAELESILLTHPKIKDVCIVGVPNDKAGEVPRAFIVIGQGEQLTENEIHEWLAPKVSYYKHLRGGIYFIDIIPKSPSGKLLRRKLRDQIKSKL